MELRRRLARWAYARPRVLLVDAPDGGRLRWQVEEELRRRSWDLALAPADADLLVVLGEPGPELSAAADVLWSQVPRPRHRQHVRAEADVAAELDAGARALWQPADDDPVPPVRAASMGQDVDFAGHDLASGAQVANHEGHQMAGGHEGHQMAGGHEGHQMAGGHEGHQMAGGHEGHQMAGGGMVAGLAMAHIGPDRDGLALDVLKVSLGPVLPGWPTGLVLRGSLQGDVFTAVTLSWADAVTPAAPAGDAAPRALDLLGRFLLVAGASTMARRAGAARDDMRASDPAWAARGRRAAAEVALRVRRSRATAWSVRGLGARPGMTASGSDRTSPVGDDVWDRVRGWCDVVVRRVASDDGTLGRSPTNDGRATDRIDLVSLAQLLEGTELAGARLVVASFDLAAAPSAAAERTRG